MALIGSNKMREMLLKDYTIYSTVRSQISSRELAQMVLIKFGFDIEPEIKNGGAVLHSQVDVKMDDSRNSFGESSIEQEALRKGVNDE